MSELQTLRLELRRVSEFSFMRLYFSQSFSLTNRHFLAEASVMQGMECVQRQVVPGLSLWSIILCIGSHPLILLLYLNNPHIFPLFVLLNQSPLIINQNIRGDPKRLQVLEIEYIVNMHHNKQYQLSPGLSNNNLEDGEDSQNPSDNSQEENQEQIEGDNDRGSARSGFDRSGHNDLYYSSKIERELEEEMLDEILFEDKKTYKDKISEELEIKLKELKATVKDKDQEEVLNIRMHELAISKILVFTHGKTPLILVIAHTHIGEAYINYKCYEQAIDHLTIALEKNKKLFDLKGKQFDTKAYHAHILTFLGKCYYEVNSYTKALEELNKAQELQKGSSNQNEISSTQTLTLISNCHAKMLDYKTSIFYIDKVIEIRKAKLGNGAFETAMALNEKSKIYALQNQHRLSLETLNHVLRMFQDQKYNKPQLLAQLFQTLASYQQKNGDVDGQQNSLQRVKKIYNDIYTPNNKKVIKIKKDIAMFLMRIDKNKQALIQLNETLTSQEKVYGEYSQQVSTTLKIIASIYKKINDPVEAETNMSRARNIDKKLKLVDSNKNKLKFTAEVREKRMGPSQMMGNKERKDRRS